MDKTQSQKKSITRGNKRENDMGLTELWSQAHRRAKYKKLGRKKKTRTNDEIRDDIK